MDWGHHMQQFVHYICDEGINSKCKGYANSQFRRAADFVIKVLDNFFGGNTTKTK